MNRDSYRLHWFLIVRDGFIHAVYGGKLEASANAKASELGARCVHIGAYGMPFHAGQSFPY